MFITSNFVTIVCRVWASIHGIGIDIKGGPEGVKWEQD